MSEPLTHIIDWVAEFTVGDTLFWAVHKVDHQGNASGHAFPKETLEWRAAEYGLDDVGEILDIVLHEPYLADAPDRDDPAARAGLVTSSRPDAQPITLYNAASTGDARAAHRLRIADAKKTRAKAQPPGRGKDPLDVIRAQHGIDPGRLQAKRELVDMHRWTLLYGGLPVAPTSLSSSLAVPEAPRA